MPIRGRRIAPRQLCGRVALTSQRRRSVISEVAFLTGLRDRLTHGWVREPGTRSASMQSLIHSVKHLFGKRFSLALLDDVVMSVDSGHRYEFCKLLKKHFPETQFIITTHDRLWAEQMKSAGLVTSKTSVAFHSWAIDTGRWSSPTRRYG